VKIYAAAAAMEALSKKERGLGGGQNRMKLSLPPKKWCISALEG
jgi:hypothetical protein